ncbi:MAG: SPOR domain-containing protein [Myxococcales bacterium]|jgi:DedD protein
MREANHRNRDRIELQLDNRQIVSFVIGSLIVLGVVFALGVMVGKQLATDAAPVAQAVDPLAQIDAQEKALADAAVEEAAAQKEAASALTFAQELTRPKAVDPIIEPTKGAAPAEPVRKEPALEEPAPEPEEPRGKGGLAAAFEKAAAKPSGSGSLAVQIASLPSRSDADKLVEKLAAKGFDAYVVAADIPGKGQYFRVKVGAFETRQEANEALAELKEKTSMVGIVTNAH